MEILVIFILVIVIVILASRKSGGSEAASKTARDIYDLARKVEELQQQIKSLGLRLDYNSKDIITKIDSIRKEELFTHRMEKVEEHPFVQPEMPLEAIITENDTDQEQKPNEEVKFAETVPIQESEISNALHADEPLSSSITTYYTGESKNSQVQPKEQEGFIDKWMRNNPDLEKFIGENLVNKIGIAVLVLGIAFFVKYAIDQDWIKETGRVCIGLGCGAILAGLAHFLRNTYRSFSSVLAGGGIAVFYFTIAFGFHEYQLMSQTAAFIIMVVITAFAIALSVLYNRLELAIIATIGGFLTPFLVSTGEGNYEVLFTYLIILNIGVLLLAYFKRWPAINIIALAFTEIIYAGWLSTVLTNPSKHLAYAVALSFATVYYLLFLGMNMVHQMKNKEKFKPFDFIILLIISSTYFGGGMCLLHSWNGGSYEGIFTLALGIINFMLAWYVYKSGKADRNLLFLLIGITLTFITLTIPIQLHGHAITLFWSAEFVLLYWLSVYSGIRVFKYSSLLICLLTLISLLMDWAKAGDEFPAGLHLIFTNIRGIVTNLVAILAFVTWFSLLSKKDGDFVAGFTTRQMSRVAIVTGMVLLFITCIFGVNLAFHSYTSSYTIPNAYHRLITELFALIFLAIASKKKELINALLQFAALIVCFLVYIFSTPAITELLYHGSAGKIPIIHSYIHWIDSILMMVLFYKVISTIRAQQDIFVGCNKVLSIFIVLLLLILISLEFRYIYVLLVNSNNNFFLVEYQFNKAGFTVIWGICSFVLMWLGMRHKEKNLRIISLVLFSIVLLKLVLFDISEISEGGKILTFILLGVLLLTVSFMYQKLKKMIIDDKK